jgi:hypothetical protein
VEVAYDKKVLFPISESPSSSTVISGGGIKGSIIGVCGGPHGRELSRWLHACFFYRSGVELGNPSQGPKLAAIR